jgi:hypothetical protein
LNTNGLFKDLTAIKNISGGSGAETWVVKSRDNAVFVRKFAAGDAGQRLKEQTRWFNDFKNRIYCPHVLNEGLLQDFYFYDMNYLSPSETLSEKLLRESSPYLTAQINTALAEFNNIFDHLTPEISKADRAQYIQDKLFKNLEGSKKKDPQFNDLASANEVVINGVAYKGLPSLLNDSAVIKTISTIENEELYSIGHGDLTLANLLVMEEAIAFTDPNPHFKFISQEQEYSKVLQSTIVKYELFKNVNFNFTGSNSFNYSIGTVRDFTDTNEQILKGDAFKGLKPESLFFHLAVHLARILPYIKPDSKHKSYVYLAEIIKLLSAISGGKYNLA